jgi:alkylhydroperoxidase family enzyme
MRVWALRPAHLERWWTYYDELLRGESGLSKPQREMIAVAVSAANECDY